MDAGSFDALARALVGRRHLVLTALTAGLSRQAPVGAKRKRKQRKRRRKHQPGCGAAERFCQGRCVGADGCCADVECRPRGECASCQEGACLPDGRRCADIYGPCSTCSGTFTCEPSPDGRRCDSCRVCQGGNCVGCAALGECAGCLVGACVPDGQICVSAYNACSGCDATTFTCTHDLTPCPAGVETRCCPADKPCCHGVCCEGVCCGPDRATGQCYVESGYICCSDAPRSGCPSADRCCGDECVDFDRNQDHCGACFTPCLANQLCVDGACSCAAYQRGTTWCESAGRCIRDEEICCGQQVCASNMYCCGSGDAAVCWPVPQCPS